MNKSSRYAELRKRILGKPSTSPAVTRTSPKALVKPESGSTTLRTAARKTIAPHALEPKLKLKVKKPLSKEKPKADKSMIISSSHVSTILKVPVKGKSAGRIKSAPNHGMSERQKPKPIATLWRKITSPAQNSPLSRTARAHADKSLFNSLSKTLGITKKTTVAKNKSPTGELKVKFAPRPCKPKVSPVKKVKENPTPSFVQSKHNNSTIKPQAGKSSVKALGNLTKTKNASSFVAKPKGEEETHKPSFSEIEEEAIVKTRIPVFSTEADGDVNYVITEENHITEKPVQKTSTIKNQLKYYEKKMFQIEDERKRKEKENEELKKCLDKLATELTEKEKKIEYFSKLQIDDPMVDEVESHDSDRGGCNIV